MNAFFHSQAARDIILILAVSNIVLGLLVFFSCRCLPGSRLARGLMQNQGYLTFYKFHCYLWLLFLISVMIHAVFAINFML
ncbi:MAG: hypothetical protein PHU70_05830 [Dehalococcoidia bacterium]|nr:hypothetical protein [Dehalococcoidia bacterium]